MTSSTFSDLQGKTVLITGGASNIGRGIALKFAEHAANVVIADVDAEQAEKTASEVRALGAQALVLIGDLTLQDVVKSIVDDVLRAFGAIDIVVNNLGWQKPSWFGDLDHHNIQQTILLNLTTTIMMTQAVLPHMVERGSGNFVNISSDAAYGEPRQSVYGAAKAGVISLTKTLAKENGKFSLRFNVVAPGLVTPPDQDWIGETSLWAGDKPVFDDRALAAVVRGIPLGRLTAPEDIANSVIFLASENTARQLTGQTISVSGGYVMPG